MGEAPEIASEDMAHLVSDHPLESVWMAALDARTLRQPDGSLDEAAYLRKRRAHLDRAWAAARVHWYRQAIADLRDLAAIAAWRQERRRLGQPFEGDGVVEYLESRLTEGPDTDG